MVLQQSHHMMATVIGLSTSAGAGKMLFSSSHHYSDAVAEKLSSSASSHHHHHHHHYPSSSPIKNNIVSSSSSSSSSAKKPSNFSSSSPNRSIQSMKALKEHIEESAADFSSSSEMEEYLVEAFLLLQKSMLEKQWNLSFYGTVTEEEEEEEDDTEKKKKKKKREVISSGKQWNLSFYGTVTEEEEEDMEKKKKKQKKKREVISSGISARQRRKMMMMMKNSRSNRKRVMINEKIKREFMGTENRFKGYVKGVVSEELLTHAQVVHLSNKIQAGLFLEDHKSRLKERLGIEPTDEEVAASLRISRGELQSKLIECCLAREKLAMSNVRLVMSIAQRYDNMGAEMADLVQGGLIGLLRGIEKFDSSKGFKISTYVYWWIRQGVSKALVENSRTLRLPSHLHERLSLIRNAKIRLQERGITPSIERIAESMNMTQKKVRNATEAINKVFSLDREAFPSLNGIPGETLHSYIADVRLENNPWHGVDEWALKDEVNKLINMTLGDRERDIIGLYYGLDSECLTWEDISKRIGLSRERVRQVGLVALEKLKHAARKSRMEAMLVKH